jgi:hypothetical protein
LLIPATARCNFGESDRKRLELVVRGWKLPSSRNLSIDLMLREVEEWLPSNHVISELPSRVPASGRELTGEVKTAVSWIGSRAVWQLACVVFAAELWMLHFDLVEEASYDAGAKRWVGDAETSWAFRGHDLFWERWEQLCFLIEVSR